MTAGISPKFNCLSRNACTAISSAAFRLAQLSPPSRAASCAWRRQGKRAGSGARKSSRADRTRSRKSTPAAMRCGQASACAIGTRMSGADSCASTEPSTILDQRMHDALRVHHDVDITRRHAEQHAGLDELEALIHEGRRVDRDLAAHVPARVRAGLCRRGMRHGLGRPVRGTVLRRRSAAAAARRGAATPARNPGGRHWNIALCSLSIGISCAPERCTAAISSAPAMTADSLLASSRRLPAPAAASAEASPAAPLMAAMT